MRVRVEHQLASYELCHWSEREADEQAERFGDRHAAARLVRELVAAGHGSSLRFLVERVSRDRGGFEAWGPSFTDLDGDELVARLADALTRGSLVAIARPVTIEVSHPPLVLAPPPEPTATNEIEDLGSVWLRPSAGADSIALSIAAEPELLGFETSHQGP